MSRERAFTPFLFVLLSTACFHTFIFCGRVISTSKTFLQAQEIYNALAYNVLVQPFSFARYGKFV